VNVMRAVYWSAAACRRWGSRGHAARGAGGMAALTDRSGGAAAALHKKVLQVIKCCS